MAGKGHKELETGNCVGIIKSGKHGTETVVCGREGEEEAGTEKQCAWRRYINRTESGD